MTYSFLENLLENMLEWPFQRNKYNPTNFFNGLVFKVKKC